MPFEEKCRNLLGQCLVLLPYYGHGWTQEDTKGNAVASLPQDSLGPAPFKLTLEEFIVSQDGLVGGVGRILEPNHAYSGFWTVFCLRHRGQFNFTINPGHCLVWITPRKPQIQADVKKAVYLWVNSFGWPRLVGY